MGARYRAQDWTVEPYAAVSTTGIYCRPGCGARPLPSNVRHFAVAAAAEAAGYRACLRCRPYRVPQPPVTSAPDLVCRAVELVLDGALDVGTEAALAARLDVSIRHLGRLFTTHLGVTPDGLARSARAHFARRLLDDTDLSVTDIAFASGFGSVRQFNRSCLAVFQLTPVELRAHRRSSDRLVADGGLRLRLPFTGPLDWPAMSALLAHRGTPGVEAVSGSSYRRTISVEGHPGVLELSPGGRDHLVLHLHLPRWWELLHLVQRARRIANLDLAVTAASIDRARDPALGRWSPYESGVRAILDDHPCADTARRRTAALVECFGTPVPGLVPWGLTHLFPPADVVCAAPLHHLDLPRSQLAALHAFSSAVAHNRLHLHRGVPLDTLLRSLRTTCAMSETAARDLALRLGHPDAHPDGAAAGCTTHRPPAMLRVRCSTPMSP